MSECANVSESLLSKFTLAVNHCAGQLAAATGAGGPVRLAASIMRHRNRNPGGRAAPLASLESVNWRSPSAILTDTLDRGC